jgi:hypothetical protein
VSRRLATLPVVIVISFGAFGCGGDSSGQTAPSISIPSVTTPTAPSTSGSTPAATTEKTKTAPGGTTFDPGRPDSPTNDVPPPQGSPQEQFEQRCEQNPEACG